MSYFVLARKWRPQTLADVAGQQPVLQALTNSLNTQRLHHAYLLTGTRGVGKTTIARILAKCLSCQAGITSTPCGTCNYCKEIEQGSYVDLIEVDAASRTKVEDTRDLLNNVQYMPAKGRYKIYLIDEVHMLSAHSFNALLKTLEEPPEHVIFLLATTDPQKLPITVLSRCLKFHLKNILPEDITQYLANILKQEKIHFEVEALKQIAKAANGSMRDALSLLDQAIAYGNQQVILQDISTILNIHDERYVIDLIDALILQNGQAILTITEQLALQAVDFNFTLDELLSKLQQIAILQVLNPPIKPDMNNPLHRLAQQITKPDVQLFYQIGLQGRRDLPLSPSQKEGFQMIMLRMLAFCPTPSLKARFTEPTFMEQSKEKQQENNSEPSQETTSPIVFTAPLPNNPIQSVNQQFFAKQALPTELPLQLEANQWPQIIRQLSLTGMAHILLSYSILANYQDNRVELLVDPCQSAMVNESLKQRITDALSKYLGKNITVKIEIAAQSIDCPAKVALSLQKKQLDEVTQALLNDQGIQLLTEKFNAKIQFDSIEPFEQIK